MFWRERNGQRNVFSPGELRHPESSRMTTPLRIEGAVLAAIATRDSPESPGATRSHHGVFSGASLSLSGSLAVEPLDAYTVAERCPV